MNIDDDTFAKIATAALAPAPPTLAAEHAAPIVQLARLTADADDREDDDEAVALGELVAHTCALAAITPPPEVDLPRDDLDRFERIGALATPLRGTPAAGLAYVVAHLLTISDLDIAPAENAFLERLREALGLDPERAGELAATAAELVTPEA